MLQGCGESLEGAGRGMTGQGLLLLPETLRTPRCGASPPSAAAEKKFPSVLLPNQQSRGIFVPPRTLHPHDRGAKQQVRSRCRVRASNA